MPIALITGASSGIGAATALALAPRWTVALCARRVDRLTALATQIRAAGGTALVLPIDVTTADGPQRAVDETVRQYGSIDVLINNAGAFAIAELTQMTPEHLDHQWALNVRAPMLMARAALPYLIATRGSIVNVSSVAAEATFTGCGAYSATKAAIEAWSRILREELRSSGVRVSVIAPGATATEAFPGDLPVDLKRLCRAEDIAQAIRFLVEQPASATIDRLVITPPGGAL